MTLAHARWAMSAGVLLLAAAAYGANGDLDPSFGTAGIALGGFNNASFLLPPKPVVQPDGKVVICSTLVDNGSSGNDFLVARFNADGTPDTSFSFDGAVTVDFDGGLGTEYCNAVAVQQDGKIVAVGASRIGPVNYDFAVTRLQPNGALDSTFGAGSGKTLVPFDLGNGNADTASAVAIQPDGKLVIAGSSQTASNGNDFSIVRLLDDGTRDTTFNLTGRVTVGFNLLGSATKSDMAYAVIVDPAGRILVGGSALKGAALNADMAVARLLPNGQLDSNFDADGRATLAFDLGPNGTDEAFAMVLQRDGRILLGGYTDTSASATSNYDMAIARMLPDGSVDSSFGLGGKAVVPFDLSSGGADVAYGLALQGNGYVLLGGAARYSSTDFRAAVARLRPNGVVDNQFGVQGKKTFNFNQTTPDLEFFFGLALQANQIIASGIVLVGPTSSSYDVVVARLQNDLLFADRFE